jgi:hypothetical protein
MMGALVDLVTAAAVVRTVASMTTGALGQPTWAQRRDDDWDLRGSPPSAVAASSAKTRVVETQAPKPGGRQALVRPRRKHALHWGKSSSFSQSWALAWLVWVAESS